MEQFVPPPPLSLDITDTYGITLTSDESLTQIDYDLAAFRLKLNRLRRGIPIKETSKPAWWHLERLLQFYWPPGRTHKAFYVVENVPKLCKEFCLNKKLAVAGSTSSGKTGLFACIAIIFWSMNPMKNKVVVTTVDIEGAKDRIWGQIIDRFNTCAVKLPGRSKEKKIMPIDPSTGRAMDTLHGLELVSGNRNKEEDAKVKIAGFKADDSSLLITDETTHIAPGIPETFNSNWRSNQLSQMVNLGNWDSPFDPFGILTEPPGGFDQVTVDDGEWMSKDGTKVVHLDGLKSTNWIMKFDYYPFLCTWTLPQGFIDDGKKDTKDWWKMVRSFPPPAGVQESGLYEYASIMQMGGMSKVDGLLWDTKPEFFFGFDGAWTEGGDEIVLYPIRYGTLKSGKKKIEGLPPHILQINQSIAKRTPAGEQICRQAKELVEEEYRTPFDHIGYDATNQAFCDAVVMVFRKGQEEEKEMIMPFPIHFGGPPTRMKTGRYRTIYKEGMPPLTKMPKDNQHRFGSRGAELWLVPKDFIEVGAVCGLDSKAVQQACIRRQDKDTITKKGEHLINIEKKKDYFSRTRSSPDRWDGFSMAMFMVIKEHKLGAYMWENKIVSKIDTNQRIDPLLKAIIDACGTKPAPPSRSINQGRGTYGSVSPQQTQNKSLIKTLFGRSI